MVKGSSGRLKYFLRACKLTSEALSGFFNSQESLLPNEASEAHKDLH